VLGSKLETNQDRPRVSETPIVPTKILGQRVENQFSNHAFLSTFDPQNDTKVADPRTIQGSQATMDH